MQTMHCTVHKRGALMSAMAFVWMWVAVASSTLLAVDNLDKVSKPATEDTRERILIDDDWRFTKDDPPGSTVSLLYDVRPQRTAGRGPGAETARAAEGPASNIMKSWILPSGNDFLKDAQNAAKRPEGNLGDG